MKNIFLILIVSFSFSFCKAQAPVNAPIISLSTATSDSFKIINNGAYFKDVDNRYAQWVGTWQYQNGNTLFKIVIEKVEGVYFPLNSGHFINPITCYVDLLVGKYYYEKDGIVISNHLTYIDPKTAPLICGGIYGYPNIENVKLNLLYREFEKRPGLTGGPANFSLLSGSTTQAKWEFDSSMKRNYSVPDNVILTKL